MKKFLLAIGLLFTVLSVAAGQVNMTITSKAELVQMDADATSYYRQTDVNDINCAIIKVTVDNPINGILVLQTRGGMAPVTPPRGMSNFRQDTGEWWFWVSPSVTNIMFTCQGYTPTDWLGVALAPGKVYRLDLSVESTFTMVKTSPNIANSGVRLTITPLQASVSYGQSKDKLIDIKWVTDGSFDAILAKGKYYFKIESPMYEAYEAEIVVEKGIKDLKVNLLPAYGTLSLTSDPPGANVYVDSELMGVTPIVETSKIPNGLHRVLFQKDNYYVYSTDVDVRGSGSAQAVPTVTLKPQFGTVTLHCPDKDADLIVTDATNKEVFRGKSGGVAQLNSQKDYKLEASKPSHISQSIVIHGSEIEGQSLEIKVDAPVALFGEIVLSSEPSRAQVYIDGEYVGTTLYAKPILIGDHAVTLKKEGYEDLMFTVTIAHEQSVKLSKEMKVAEAEWVDLGLPSGTKWASCNLGASSPEEYGDYYAWGDTEPYYTRKKNIHWKARKMTGYTESSYKYCNNSLDMLNKYCPYAYSKYWDESGLPDGKVTLDAADDAAYAKLGGQWRMPTITQWEELTTKCKWVWTKENGVYGRKVTGPNGNSIFLPAAGIRKGTKLEKAGSDGAYWSSSLCLDSPRLAWIKNVNNEVSPFPKNYRNFGLSIRPVLNEEEEPEWVDLGLPSGLKWASCNLGASRPEEPGDYYAWGETEPYYCGDGGDKMREGKSDGYTWKSYKHCKKGASKLTKYCTTDYNDYWKGKGRPDGKSTLEPEDDVAAVKLGDGAHIPTIVEWKELESHCKFEKAWINSVVGLRVTGPNGKSIFLPASSCKEGYYSDREGGRYWSSSMCNSNPSCAWHYYFTEKATYTRDRKRCHGLTIRAVK
ncbi:MAG: PEGA domain-containing protein [Bacteroidales bacterium]|nr:PEGA domain-containing protein [Bacteroidales bacterium]